MKDYGYFGPDSITWKIASEAVIMLGGSRAVLMQLAHPLVAVGVSAHTSYMTDPFGRSARTLTLGQMLTFGSRATAHKAARTINRLHTHVYGTLPEQAGDYIKGTPYKARNPELLRPDGTREIVSVGRGGRVGLFIREHHHRHHLAIRWPRPLLPGRALLRGWLFR